MDLLCKIPVKDVSDDIYLSVAISNADYNGITISVSSLLNGSLLVSMKKGNRYKQYLLSASDLCKALIEEGFKP